MRSKREQVVSPFAGAYELYLVRLEASPYVLSEAEAGYQLRTVSNNVRRVETEHQKCGGGRRIIRKSIGNT